MTQNDVMQLLIGKDVGAGSPTTSAGSPIYEASDTYLLDGEMAVVNSHNIVLSAASVLTDDLVKKYGCKIIQRSGSKLIESDLIPEDNILNYKGQTDTAIAEQISYIGYNGSANDIEVNNSTLYVIRLLLKEQDLTGFGQEIILNAAYKSDAAATQAEIANGLALILSNTLRRQAVQPIKSELLNSVAVDTAYDFDHTCTIVKGEKAVTVATNSQYNTGTELAVGDYVRFGATSTTENVLTDGIYKVLSLDSGTQFSVDRPIEAESGAYATGSGYCQVLLAATANAADFGIKLTGIAREFSMPKKRYSKVSFDVGLDDGFGDTVSAVSTKMSLGHGYYAEIAELEYDLLGNAGNPYNADPMWSAHKSDAETSGYYDVINMTYYDAHATEGIGATPRRQKQLVLAFKAGFSDTEAPDIASDVLDAYTPMTNGIGV